MTRIGCFALVWLLGAPAFGQKTWSVSGGAVPAFVRIHYPRMTLYPDSDGQLVEPIDVSGRANAFSYATGLTLHYTYASGWSVATGVWYRAQLTRQPRRTAASEGTTTIRERTVRIPVLFNYRSCTRRLSPYYSFGLLVDLPQASRIIERRTNQPMQNLHLDVSGGPVFSVLLGAGGVYQINSHWAVLAQPIGTYKLGRFGGDQTNSPGVELGLLTQVMRSF